LLQEAATQAILLQGYSLEPWYC